MSALEPKKDEMVHVARLWSQAQPIVSAMVAGAVVNFHDTEDLVAEVAETVVRRFEEYDSSRPFVPWALGIARNLVLRHYERRAGVRATYFDELTLQSLEAAHLDMVEELPARMLALRQCLDSVRGRARRVLELRYMHDLKPDAVANALGTNRNAVWVTLHRIRTALKKCIEQKLASEA